jgi:uncharacterized membrane protein
MVPAIQTKKETVMNKIIKLAGWPFIIAPAIYLAIVWDKLPDKVATHFNLQGIADQYGDKNQLLIMVIVLAGLAAVIYLLLPLVYKIDPKKRAIENKGRLQRISFAIALFMSFVTCIIIYSAEHGNFHFNIRLIFGSIGVLWCVMGNYMHNIKPNNFAGFRVAWTLNNEENWRKTHLLGSKTWFAGGLLIAIASLFAPQNVLIGIFVIISVIIILIPFIYSSRLHKKQLLAKN